MVWVFGVIGGIDLVVVGEGWRGGKNGDAK